MQGGGKLGLAGVDVSSAEMLRDSRQLGRAGSLGDREGVLQDPDGIAVFASLQTHEAQGVENTGVSGSEFDGSLRDFEGAVEVTPALGIDPGEVVCCDGGPVSGTYGSLIVFDCGSVVATLLGGDSLQHLRDSGNEYSVARGGIIISSGG